MTVGELIGILERYDEDLDVLIVSQPSWPFEYSIDGIVARSEIFEERDEYDEEEEDKEDDCVFICEGNQLRYGRKAAWDNCTRY